MKPNLLATFALSATLLTLAAKSAYAQQEAEWRVINAISPTVVPLYSNLNSPFHATGPAAAISATGPTPEEIAHQQLLANTLSRARAQVLSPASIEPRFDGILCNGALQGPLGWTALCSGRWIRTGAMFQVGAQAAPSVDSALSALTELDADSASGLRSQLQQRIATTQLQLTVTKITAHTIEFSHAGKSWQLPIRQAVD